MMQKMKFDILKQCMSDNKNNHFIISHLKVAYTFLNMTKKSVVGKWESFNILI